MDSVILILSGLVLVTSMVGLIALTFAAIRVLYEDYVLHKKVSRMSKHEKLTDELRKLALSKVYPEDFIGKANFIEYVFIRKSDSELLIANLGSELNYVIEHSDQYEFIGVL